MLWSFLARRLTLAAVAARIAHPAPLSAVARRTLFATSQLNFPPAKAAQSTEEKATCKKAAEREHKTPAKRGRPRKNPADSQKKQPVRIPKILQPPKRAPGPYLLFYSSFLKTQPKGNSLQECQALSKRAAEVWKGYSMSEKQPFYDESEARAVQAKQARDEFFRNMSQSDLRKLNAIRKARGKFKVHSTTKHSVPTAPFILFSNEFRNSPDGQALINETAPEKSYIVRSSLAAANCWKSMSEEEKAPYFERSKRAREEYKAEHPKL